MHVKGFWDQNIWEPSYHVVGKYLNFPLEIIIIFLMAITPMAIWKVPGRGMNSSHRWAYAGHVKYFNPLHQASHRNPSHCIVGFLTYCTIVGTPGICEYEGEELKRTERKKWTSSVLFLRRVKLGRKKLIRG